MSGNRLILFAFWGPEIRLFVHSGLISSLLESNPVTLVSRVIDGDFTDQIPPGCSLVKLPHLIPPRNLARLTTLANTAHGEYMSRMGFNRALEGKAGQKQSYSVNQSIRRILAKSLSYQILVRVFSLIENRLLISWIKKVPDFYIQECELPNSILVTTDHPIALFCLQYFLMKGSKTLFLYSNWKDATRGIRARPCIQQHLVWSHSMSESVLRQNPRLPNTSIAIVGTPQFDNHLNMDIVWSREDFCSKFGLDPSRPVLCYTAASRRIIPNESSLIKDLCDLIQCGKIIRNPQVIVRTNPTGSDPRIENLVSKYSFLRVVPAEWDFRPGLRDGQWQSAKNCDVDIFTNIIHHSAMNISAPSTVTLDFAISDKPIVNLAYDPPGPIEGQSITTFVNQEVFKPAVQLGACQIVHTKNEMERVINIYLSDPTIDCEGRRAFVRSQLDETVGQSVSLIRSALI